jgi:hypothetical protein
MFEIKEETTWWSPQKHTVLDARDIALMGVVKGMNTDTYTLHITLTGAEDKKEFHYGSLADLNTVLNKLGLNWVDDVT